jgi:hypothetical protein
MKLQSLTINGRFIDPIASEEITYFGIQKKLKKIFLLDIRSSISSLHYSAQFTGSAIHTIHHQVFDK